MYLSGACLLLSHLAFVQSALKLDFSKFTPLCSRSDPNLDECAHIAANKVLKVLGPIMPEYGLEDIHPLKIPLLELTHSDAPVGLNMNISNSVHTGIIEADIVGVHIEPDNHEWVIHTKMPRYSIEGICNTKGKILALPILGNGRCNLTSVNHDVTVIMNGGLEKKSDGLEYLELKTMKLKMTFTKGHFDMEGLFEGNKLLGDELLKILNENSLDVLNEVKPVLELVWANLFKEILQKVFDIVPFDQVLGP